MTRKDYIKLADALYATKPTTKARLEQWRSDCNAVIYVLQADNCRFDKGKFLDALGAK